MNPKLRLLAIESGTEHLSVALGEASVQPDAPRWVHRSAGGPSASSALIPAVRSLLDQAGWALAELDGIAFGCGPGSFTGLRTACAVAQGLAEGARTPGLPVLPVSSLLALAEQARPMWAAWRPTRLQALIDARMGEVYHAGFDVTPDGECLLTDEPTLCKPSDLPPCAPTDVLVAFGVAPHLTALPDAWRALPRVEACPDAEAMLRLAPALWRRGLTVDAARASPLYVRNRVALTTAEREAARAPQATTAPVAS